MSTRAPCTSRAAEPRTSPDGPTVVAFDLDDTLILEEEYVMSGFRAVDAWLERRLGVAGLYQAARGLHEVGVRGRVFDLALGDLGVPPEPTLVARLVRVYRDHRPDIRLLPDARICLHRLRRAGVPLALVTDGPQAQQQQKLSALLVEQYFDEIVISDRLGAGRSKPHVAPFLAVMSAFPAEGTRFAYVGDNPVKDFATPRSLGWTTVRVRRGRGQYAGLEAPAPYAADAEVEALTELEAVLAGLPETA